MIKRASAFLLLAAIAIAAMPSAALAAEDGELDAIHHSANAYYLDFTPIGKLQLPRIFVVQHEDGSYGLELFGSTAAAILEGGWVAEIDHDGEEHAEGEEGHAEDGAQEAHAGEGEAQETGKYAGITLAQLEGHLVPPGGGHVVLDMSISKHLVFAWLGMIVVAFIMVRMAGMYKRGVGRDTAPKGLFQNLFETLILFIRDDVARPNLGAKTEKYLPYLLTVFFFILTCNLLGLVPFGATATSNLMVTTVLASFTFLLTQFGGTKDYWMHILWPPGIPAFVKPILMPVELLGIFTKPIALAIRLFANLTAGHLIILSLIGLIFSFANMFGPTVGYAVAPVSIAFALFIYCLELLVSFIQAYVFTMLSALFIGMAVVEHHHDHDEAHGEHHAEPTASVA
jgi:F-type H+-transporting ATPase subunit a